MGDQQVMVFRRMAGESWHDANARLADLCRLHRFTLASLDPTTLTVVLDRQVGAPILVSVWPLVSDDPTCAIDTHLERAASRAAGDLTYQIGGGVMMLVERLDDAAPALDRVGGRPPFGFRAGPGPGGLVPDPDTVPVVRLVYAAETAGADMQSIATQVLAAFPKLASQSGWSGRERVRTIGRILARREQLEQLLVGTTPRKETP